MQSEPENFKNKTTEDYKEILKRFSRQTAFSDLGEAGQIKLSKSTALVVGMGGLGSWTAEFLVRAGIGRIKICDGDCVEISNLHRQALYTEQDAAEKRLKVECAAEKLKKIISDCIVEPFAERISRLTIQRIAKNADIIMDGTDNFETRFLINDYSVKFSIPWISAGVAGACGQVMCFLPGETACLRCVVPSIPFCSQETADQCNQLGVIGPVVSFTSAMQTVEAIKILSGSVDFINPYLTAFDLWRNYFQRFELQKVKSQTPCPCCEQRIFEYLEP